MLILEVLFLVLLLLAEDPAEPNKTCACRCGRDHCHQLPAAYEPHVPATPATSPSSASDALRGDLEEPSCAPQANRTPPAAQHTYNDRLIRPFAGRPTPPHFHRSMNRHAVDLQRRQGIPSSIWCEPCAKQFGTVVALHQHQAAVHWADMSNKRASLPTGSSEAKTTRFECDVCKGHFAGDFALRQHKAEHHPWAHICTAYIVTFRTAADANQHYQSVHKAQTPDVHRTQSMLNILNAEGPPASTIAATSADPRPRPPSGPWTRPSSASCDTGQGEHTLSESDFPPLSRSVSIHSEEMPPFTWPNLAEDVQQLQTPQKRITPDESTASDDSESMRSQPVTNATSCIINDGIDTTPVIARTLASPARARGSGQTFSQGVPISSIPATDNPSSVSTLSPPSRIADSPWPMLGDKPERLHHSLQPSVGGIEMQMPCFKYQSQLMVSCEGSLPGAASQGLSNTHTHPGNVAPVHGSFGVSPEAETVEDIWASSQEVIDGIHEARSRMPMYSLDLSSPVNGNRPKPNSKPRVPDARTTYLTPAQAAALYPKSKPRQADDHSSFRAQRPSPADKAPLQPKFDPDWLPVVPTPPGGGQGGRAVRRTGWGTSNVSMVEATGNGSEVEDPYGGW